MLNFLKIGFFFFFLSLPEGVFEVILKSLRSSCVRNYGKFSAGGFKYGKGDVRKTKKLLKIFFLYTKGLRIFFFL